MNETGIGLSEFLTFLGGVIAALAGSALAHSMMTNEEKRRFSLETCKQLFINVHHLRAAANHIHTYKMAHSGTAPTSAASVIEGASSLFERLTDAVAKLRADVFALKMVYGAKAFPLEAAVEAMIEGSSKHGRVTTESLHAFSANLQSLSVVVFREVARLHKQLTSEFQDQ